MRDTFGVTVQTVGKIDPTIPCTACGTGRRFLAGVQWCGNCGWNVDNALVELRLRARIFAGLALVLFLMGIGWMVALRGGPAVIVGLFYLLFLGSLAWFVFWFPYREHRDLRRFAIEVRAVAVPRTAADEVITRQLENIVVKTRLLAWFVLGLIWSVAIFVAVNTRTWGEAFFAVIWLYFSVEFAKVLMSERHTAKGFGTAMATVTGFKPKGRGGRVSLYEYRTLDHSLFHGEGGGLSGWDVGMTVPVLYSLSKPSDSIPVPDFLFHRILTQQPMRPQLSTSH